MTLNEYQEKAVSTAIYPSSAKLVYPILGLNGEAGEVAEKMKKIIRDNEGIINEDQKNELAKELGDVLWYVANTANDLGMTLSEIASINVEKIQSRKDRGVIKGQGDDR